MNPRLRFRVLIRDGYKCVFCGSAPPNVVLHVDHLYPKSLGGPDVMENLVTACVACNQGKRDMILAPEFLERFKPKDEPMRPKVVRLQAQKVRLAFPEDRSQNFCMDCDALLNSRGGCNTPGHTGFYNDSLIRNISDSDRQGLSDWRSVSRGNAACSCRRPGEAMGTICDTCLNLMVRRIERATCQRCEQRFREDDLDDGYCASCQEIRRELDEAEVEA